MRLKWLTPQDVEKKVRPALGITKETPVGIQRANFDKIRTQKFFVIMGDKRHLASFFAERQTAEKESLILKFLRSPKLVYFKNGLLVREIIEGVVLKIGKDDEKILRQAARMLIRLQQHPVEDDFKRYYLSFVKIKHAAEKSLPRAKKAFAPFSGGTESFDAFAEILKRPWAGKLKNLPKGFVHGDFQPLNILVDDKGLISLIDFDASGYFYPLYDAASFYVQYKHFALLERCRKGEKPNRREIKEQLNLFLEEYKAGGGEFDEEIFRLFKLLILYNGLSFSTAGFKKQVAGGHKHLLFGLFKEEVGRFQARPNPR